MSGDLDVGAERKRALALRRALSPGERARISREVAFRFFSGCGIRSSEWRALRVALYRALPDELDLESLERELSERGALLFFPRVLDARQGLMEMAQGLVPLEGVWPRGAYGLEEPPALHPAVDPRDLDLIVVPGVVFGQNGERHGMGAGFYDRYLPRAPQALRVALAFDFQLVSRLRQETWDQSVDWIWTESRQIRLETRLKRWKPPVRNSIPSP